jgi:hypothetical protein
MDKVKELTKNPFKYKNKYNKELEFFNKILDKNSNVIVSEKDDKLIIEFDKILLKTKNAIQAQIRGTVLNDLGYVEIAQDFYNKAKELGFILENKIILENNYADDDLENIEEFITNKLVNKFIQKELLNNELVNCKITHVDFNNHSVNLTFEDNENMEITYKELNNLFDNKEILKKDNTGYNTIVLLSEIPELELAENKTITDMNEPTLENSYYDNLDNMYFKFTKGYKPEEDPTIKENINEFVNSLPEEYNRDEVTDYLSMYLSKEEIIQDVTLESIHKKTFKPGDSWSNVFNYNDMLQYALTIDKNTDIEILKELKKSLVDVNFHKLAEELVDIIAGIKNEEIVNFDKFKNILKTEISNTNESMGTINIEEDIANDLYNKIKDILNYKVTDLELEIINNGGTLDMVDKIMGYLVGMGIDFENETEEELMLEEEPYLKESKKMDYDKYFLNKTQEFGIKDISEMTPEQWEEIDNNWVSTTENKYKEYFLNKLKEFNVDSPAKLTNVQWQEIDNDWNATNESLRDVTIEFKNINESVNLDVKLANIVLAFLKDEKIDNNGIYLSLNEIDIIKKTYGGRMPNGFASPDKSMSIADLFKPLMSNKSPLYFDDTDLVLGDKTILGDAVNKYTYKDAAKALDIIINESLRDVTVEFENGDVVNTNMSANLSDDDINTYYKKGREFNIGSGGNDNIQKVSNVIINETTITLSTLNPNDYKQIMPLVNDANPKYNVFNIEDNDKVYVKPDYNIDAVKRMIESDSFLKFSYHNLLTGDFHKDMEMIYKTYIKNDAEYSAKLKTYESYTKMLKENILATAKYTTMLQEVINNFDLDLGTENTEIIFNMSEFIDQNKDKFKSYFALLTTDLKEEFKNKIGSISYTEITQELLDSNFNAGVDDIDNVSNLSLKLKVSEQLALLLMNILKSVYISYSYKNITNDTNTNSILFMTIIAVIFKTIF